jgi:hypothetical protein
VSVMTVDTKGMDHEVIASNDWNRYRPKLLQKLGYQIYAKSYNTFFFVD